MNTDVRPDHSTVPVENSRRIIPIFANLMPTEVIETRRGRQARHITLIGLVLLAVVLGGGYTLTVLQTSTAQGDLDSAQDRATQLTRQQNQYADVVKIQKESDLIEKQLATLLASDLRWSTVLSSLRDAAPSGVQLTDVSGALAPPEQATRPAEGHGLPSSSDAKPVGTITVTGTGPSKPVIAGYVDALGKVSGVVDPYLNSVAVEEDDVWRFSLRLTITTEALGGRFTEPESKAGGN